MIGLKEKLLFIYFSEVRNKACTKPSTNVKIGAFKTGDFISKYFQVD